MSRHLPMPATRKVTRREEKNMKKLFKLFIFALLPMSLASCNNAPAAPIKVAAITLNVDESVSMDVGDSITIVPTAWDREHKEIKDREYIFNSSNREVCSITPAGVVTAIKPGKTTITVITGTQIASCHINIGGEEPIELLGLSFDPDNVQIVIGGSYTPNLVTYPAGIEGLTYNWYSADEDIAVIESGSIIAKNKGETTIKAVHGDIEASMNVKVVEQGEAFSISLDKSNASLLVGESLKLNAITSAPATVTWTSTDSGVAQVDSNGNVTANKKGSVTITASANGEKATCTVVVSDGTHPSETNLTIYFYVDYNNVDIDNPYATLEWYTDVPLGTENMPAAPTSIPDPAFPVFKGWSDHTIIDDLADLWNFETGVVPVGTFVYVMYGIWFDE